MTHTHTSTRRLSALVLIGLLLAATITGCGAAQPFGCTTVDARSASPDGHAAAPAGAAGAAAQTITCPTDLDEASDPAAASWAAHRIDSINAEIATDPDRFPAHRTYGELYDEDGTALWLQSNETDRYFERAYAYLSLLPAIRAPKQAAGHVESKAATVVREAEADEAVLVVNKNMCDYAGSVGCARVMPQILPEDVIVVVWSPEGRTLITGRADT